MGGLSPPRYLPLLPVPRVAVTWGMMAHLKFFPGWDNFEYFFKQVNSQKNFYKYF